MHTLIIKSLILFLISVTFDGNGVCAVKKLHNIIDAIDPYVMFEKLEQEMRNSSASNLNNNINNNNQNLETTTSSGDGDIVFIQTPPILTATGTGTNLDPPLTSKRPQSLTIFMNFQEDGTTSMQVLHDYNFLWTDLGNCRHGQIYDAIAGICRDVFCLEGYMFSAQGCIPDPNFNTTKPIKKPPSEMQIEVTFLHKLCFYIKGQNDTVECKHELALNPENQTNFLNEIKNNLSSIMQIDPSRIANLEVKKYVQLNETVDMFKHELKTTQSFTSTTSMSTSNQSYSERLMTLNKIESNEYLKISFLLKDNKNFTGEKETILLFYYLTMLAMDNRAISLPNKHQALITEVKTSSQHSWCSSPGDYKLLLRDGFHVLASFDKDNKPSYYVYVNKTETLYATGYFYLTVLFGSKGVKNGEKFGHYDEADSNIDDEVLVQTNDFDILNLKSTSFITESERNKQNLLNMLTDVTEIIFQQENSSNFLFSKLLTVCERAPKVRVECVNHEVIRLRQCELTKMKDRSYCSELIKKCFTIDEYEIDILYPNEYIRVCKQEKKEQSNHSSTNTTNFYFSLFHKLNGKSDLSAIISGWVSFVSTFISLMAMVLTLITYGLFSELRNIPGWNIINLTIALTLGQFSFISGSLFNELPIACFIISLATHYFLLAAFFWMNIIAFDLYRNFRKKSSHILLQSVTLRDRLPKYALYAWVSPLLIVLIAITIDLTVKENKLNAPFRPCYAGYIKGCRKMDILADISNNYEQSFNKNQTNALFWKSYDNYLDGNENSNNVTNEPCYDRAFTNFFLSYETCWIQNGRANLIFFGLPIAIIIIVNAIYYFLTVYNIRKKKRTQKKNKLRRFSKVKLPGDGDVKFYIQMAFIMGFTWITGFLLTTFPSNDAKFQIINQILMYIFILSNASIGVFIFFVFIFKHETRNLYKQFFIRNVLSHFMSENEKQEYIKKNSLQKSTSYNNAHRFVESRARVVSECSTTSASTSSPIMIKQNSKGVFFPNNHQRTSPFPRLNHQPISIISKSILPDSPSSLTDSSLRFSTSSSYISNQSISDESSIESCKDSQHQQEEDHF